MADKTAPVRAHKVVQRTTARLVPDARNARKHSRTQVKKLAASIREFGFTAPVLIGEDGGIIAGHGRVLAARELGMAKVPCIVLTGLTAAQRRAYIVADNRLAELATWDASTLAHELRELQTLQAVDVAVLGFSTKDLERYTAPAATAGEDDDDGAADLPAVELPATTVTRRGDLWQMGRHRLLCGDATQREDVQRALDGLDAVDMVLTDPPYCSGGFQEAARRGGSVGTRGHETVANDTLSTRGYVALLKAALPLPGAGVVYVFTDWRMWVHLFDVVESCGYGVRNMVVWDKGTPGMGAGWRMQHELIMCGVKVSSPFDPKKAVGNVVKCARTGNKHHPTEKPVDLLCEVMDVTAKCQTVADPFAGSGSTILAAQRTGRVARALELTPQHTDVAVRRWEQYAGEEARLAGDGRTFAQVAAARAQAEG